MSEKHVRISDESVHVEFDPTVISKDVMREAMGGELGATLFVAGVRIWIPEAAKSADLQHAAEAIMRFAACRE